MAIQPLSSAAALSSSIPDSVDASNLHHLAVPLPIQPLNSAAHHPSSSPDSQQRRHPSPPPSEEYLAHCLIMLLQWGSCSRVSPPELFHKCPVCGKGFPSHQALAGHKSSHRRPETGVRPKSDALLVAPVSSGGSGISTGSNRAHECNVCGSVFPTGQALGGHKSSHRRLETGVWPKSDALPVAPVSSGGSGVSTGSGRAHECNACGRVFPTGQALGGHKRRHYLEGLSPSSSSSPPPPRSSVRDIDLNITPPMEPWVERRMEEGEDEVQSCLPFKKRRLTS